jgi:hypothetical protein
MGDNRQKSAATGECLELASRCLIESNRTMDRDVADTLRNLAKRYFRRLTGTSMSEPSVIRPGRRADGRLVMPGWQERPNK